MADETDKQNDEAAKAAGIGADQAAESRAAADTAGTAHTPEANDSDPNAAETLKTGPEGVIGGTHRVSLSADEGGQRGFTTKADGTVMLAPGGEAVVTLDADEEKRLGKFGFFDLQKNEGQRRAASRSGGQQGKQQSGGKASGGSKSGSKSGGKASGKSGS